MRLGGLVLGAQEVIEVVFPDGRVLPPRDAVALFKGTCGRGIYDNMKTAVETIFIGKQRLYNRRFLQMCSHYLVDPVACTPASGWEKGQVENQVGLVRERFFIDDAPSLACVLETKRHREQNRL
jgi:transposase